MGPLEQRAPRGGSKRQSVSLKRPPAGSPRKEPMPTLEPTESVR
jgi:hypothetical protein